MHVNVIFTHLLAVFTHTALISEKYSLEQLKLENVYAFVLNVVNEIACSPQHKVTNKLKIKSSE